MKINKMRTIISKRVCLHSVSIIRNGLLLCVMLLMPGLQSRADETEYKKVLTEGKCWEYVSDNLALGPSDIHTGVKYWAEVIGDTLVYSKPAKKVLIKYVLPDKEVYKHLPKTGEKVRVFIEENGRIYEQLEDRTIEYMNMRYGDKPFYHPFMSDDCMVHDDYIDSPFGKLKRRYYDEVKDWWGVYRPLAVIEGVGTSNTLLTPDFQMSDGYYYYKMLAVYYNDEVLFTENDFRPFPAELENVDADNNDNMEMIYSVNGYRVSSSCLVPGLYLRLKSGKTEKFVVK